MSIKKTKIVIVGNADVITDFTNLVDNADLVFRFNSCRNYKINTGSKTDVLCVSNTGSAAKRLAFFYENTNPDFIYDINAVWFVSDLLSLKKNFFYLMTNQKRKVEYSKYIISKCNFKSGVEFKYLGNEFVKNSLNNLLSKGSVSVKPYAPSTGYLVLDKLLNDSDFNNSEIILIGFSWEGWKRHPWVLEKKTINTYVDLGRVSLLF